MNTQPTQPAAQAPQQEVPSADSLRHQNKLLAEALGACIMASGIVRKDIDGFTGPQLLHFANDLRSMLEAAPQQASTVAIPCGPTRKIYADYPNPAIHNEGTGFYNIYQMDAFADATHDLRTQAQPVGDDLRAAAKAVVERWDTPPLWKDVPATAEYIGRLRAALAAQLAPYAR